jgi:hypothetical protein
MTVHDQIDFGLKRLGGLLVITGFLSGRRQYRQAQNLKRAGIYRHKKNQLLDRRDGFLIRNKTFTAKAWRQLPSNFSTFETGKSAIAP